MEQVTVTWRGVYIAALSVVTFLVIFATTTSDVCWTGAGYGSCDQMIAKYAPHTE